MRFPRVSRRTRRRTLFRAVRCRSALSPLSKGHSWRRTLELHSDLHFRSKKKEARAYIKLVRSVHTYQAPHFFACDVPGASRTELDADCRSAGALYTARHFRLRRGPRVPTPTSFVRRGRTSVSERAHHSPYADAPPRSRSRRSPRARRGFDFDFLFPRLPFPSRFRSPLSPRSAARARARDSRESIGGHNRLCARPSFTPAPLLYAVTSFPRASA